MAIAVIALIAVVGAAGATVEVVVCYYSYDVEWVGL